MSLQTQIHDCLVRELTPVALEVINESHMHNVPKNSETHFKVVVVSDRFGDTSAVERHRMVHAALAAPLSAGVHALSIQAFTPEQWEARGGQIPPSPPCLGGSKADAGR